MDESTGTCNKRFAKAGIPQTEEVRRAYREWIVTTPSLAACINGAILAANTTPRWKGSWQAHAALPDSTRRNRVVDLRSAHRTDLPLTARGEDEARTPSLLREVDSARVLTGPRQRARRTCELAGLGSVSEVEPDLAEWDYGEYEGRCTVDIREGRPDWKVFRDGWPGGETTAQVSDRADRLIACLLALGGNIALFSHGQFGCVLAARWIGMPTLDGQHFMLSAASLSMLGFEPSHPDVGVTALWNAVLAGDRGVS